MSTENPLKKITQNSHNKREIKLDITIRFLFNTYIYIKNRVLNVRSMQNIFTTQWLPPFLYFKPNLQLFQFLKQLETMLRKQLLYQTLRKEFPLISGIFTQTTKAGHEHVRLHH